VLLITASGVATEKYCEGILLLSHEDKVLTGIHILLTLKCTNECDHCFLHCCPSREATFTVGQLRTLIDQIKELKTVTVVYFEGGDECHLCYTARKLLSPRFPKYLAPKEAYGL
jgi:hypothetical protein